METCTEAQEKIACGTALTLAESRHVADCGVCAVVAEDASRLQALLDETSVNVPEGFADRVMARLDDGMARPEDGMGRLDDGMARPVALPAQYERLIDRRWVQVALAHMGALVTLANVVRFVAWLLVPSSSLGATP